MAINKRVSLQLSNMSNASQAEALLERFKTLYREMNARDLKLDLLKQVYAEDMVFHDSFHHIQGRENFIAYCENLYANLRRCDFQFHEQSSARSRQTLMG